jgi:hypothetical protein
MSASPSADGIIAAAQHSAVVAGLAGGSTFVPKGVYRFKSHEDAARQEEIWLAEGMARLAQERALG